MRKPRGWLPKFNQFPSLSTNTSLAIFITNTKVIYREITVDGIFHRVCHRQLNKDRNQKFISGSGVFFSLSFLPSLPSLSLLFSCLEVAPQIQLRNLGSEDFSSPSGREGNDICSHQTRSMGSKYTKMHLWPSPGHKLILVHLEPRDCKMSSGFY